MWIRIIRGGLHEGTLYKDVGRQSQRMWQYSKAVLPSLFWHQGAVSWKTIFPQSEVVGDGFGIIQVHYIYCALYFYYCYTSCTSDHQAFIARGSRVAGGIVIISRPVGSGEWVVTGSRRSESHGSEAASLRYSDLWCTDEASPRQSHQKGTWGKKLPLTHSSSCLGRRARVSPSPAQLEARG